MGADLGDLPATIDPCQPTSPTYPDPPINIPNPPFSAISMRERGTKQRSVIWSCRCTSRSEGKFTNTTLVDFFCKEWFPGQCKWGCLSDGVRGMMVWLLDSKKYKRFCEVYLKKYNSLDACFLNTCLRSGKIKFVWVEMLFM